MTALVIGCTAYSHYTSDATKLFQVCYTTIATYLDDKMVPEGPFLNFYEAILTGAVSEHPVLDRFAKGIASLKDYFPLYSANMMVSVTLDFYNVTLLENGLLNRAVHPSARSFLNDRRKRSGVGEVYAGFIWEKERFPDPSVYLQAIP